MTAKIAPYPAPFSHTWEGAWNVQEFRAELAVLTSGMVRICELTTLDETRAFAWDLAVEMLWMCPVAPLFMVRGGLSEIVEDAAIEAWRRWN